MVQINTKNTFLLLFIFFTLFLNAQSKKWTLSECVAYALEKNISIKQTDLENNIAKINKSDAIGNFLPTLNASTSHSWNIGLNQNITTGLLENQTTQFTSVGINSNIAIYNGLQNVNRLRRANLTAISAQYQLTKMKDDISLNVANAFLQILFNKENLKVQNEQQANTSKQIKRTQELVDAGSVPRGDLLDIKATLAANIQATIVAENTLLLSRLSLAQLLQLDNFQDFDIVDSDYAVAASPTMLQSPQAIYEKAKEQRVELKLARTNLEIAEKDVKIAKGAFQPSLGGFYSFSTRAGSSDRIIGIDANGKPITAGPLPLFDQFSTNKGHSFGVQLTIPILNRFSVKNNVARSQVNLERSKIAFNQQELDLERNVFTAIADAKGALNSYESAQSALAARTEAFNYAKERFAVGMMNAFDLNQSQTLYVNAQSEVLRTKYNYIFRVKVVEFYFGIPITQN